MGQWVTIHPILRENIPYSLEVEIDGGRVINARCGAAAFWGLETALAGKHPFDALQVVQRFNANAGVSHAIAAAAGFERLLQVAPAGNSRLLRNILQGLEFIHSHITHFYQGVLPDFLDIAGAPAAGENLPPAVGKDLREHYWQSFETLAVIHRAMAVFGGRMPCLTSIVPGGVAVRPDYQKVFEIQSHRKAVLRFIRDTYIKDVENLFVIFREYTGVGAGSRRMLAMGAFPLRDGKDGRQMFFPPGTSPGASAPPDINKLSEDTAYTWFKGVSGSPGALPEPELKDRAYSWLPVLKFEEQRWETGPLARMTMAGEERTARLGVQAYSAAGRHLARAYESLWLAEKMEEWIDGLKPGKPALTGEFKVPEEGEGWAVAESPAGSVVHRFRLQAGRIEFYRVFGAAAWNLSPRDSGERMGPLEEALIGTPVANPQDPAEVLRVFRAFT
ncbi:MAG: nickel-dependent hydrogenase large subunit [Bacillota bacterium]